MIKITKADRIFGLCVKERAGWKCEVCHKQYHKGHQGFHQSHYHSRTYQSVRHDPKNVSAMCWGCHRMMEKNADTFYRWQRNWITEGDSEAGEYELEELRKRKDRLFKGYKLFQKDIEAHYLKEYENLLKRRQEGDTGWLDFEPWRGNGI